MEDTGPRALLDRAQQLFLRKDLDGFADLFAADGTHELPFAPPGVPRLLRGREEIRRYLTSITATPMELTGFHDLAVHETRDPEVVIAEYEGRGRVVSTGRPYRMTYIQLLRARGGEIVTWRDYWSPLAGFRALGLRALLPTVARTARARWRRARQAG
ncbi:nuclear transport factor 2 family protein [Nonomuraea sp. SBT364]|uniref:nuclear transport factor 2 family protein n=1 Tax=Nonomuraea sp. SBT364 TaxID=1580530 RepID=UPI00066AC323|nr:nuclear transport factor 2 family protein [Nonomuraea sp. SBT364]